MHPPILNREQTREVDRRAVEQYGMSSLVLMENAGRGVVDKLFQFGIPGPVVVCCGKGNNAGDGFVVARHLDLRYQQVRVLLLADPAALRGDALANYQILAKTDVPIEVFGGNSDEALFAAALPKTGWIVDALLGTGATGDPRPPFDRTIDLMNAASARRVAVDLPSGLDCDTGAASSHTIRADHTCTFVAPKPGFFAENAETYTGVVHVLDIGAPRKLVDEMLAEGPRTSEKPPKPTPF
jgi:NAD(P)H-hydrate epimerase